MFPRGLGVIVISTCTCLRRTTICAVVLMLVLFIGSARAEAQTVSPSTATPQITPVAQPDPQQVHEELTRLRQEFEAIRDSYGARLAALEAKLGTAAEAPSPPAAPTGVVVPPDPAASLRPLRRHQSTFRLVPQERAAPRAPCRFTPVRARAPRFSIPTSRSLETSSALRGGTRSSRLPRWSCTKPR